MELETRRRELARKKRRRQRQLRRRLALAGGAAALGVVCLVVGIFVSGRPDIEKEDLNGRESAFSAPDREVSETEGRTSADVQDRITGIEVRETMAAMVSVSDQDSLPVKFDLRDRGISVSVPDQGTFGTCWAFASLKALETSMPEAIREPLAADHMSLKNSFGLGQDDGGDHSLSSAYLLAWQGPVAEAEDPYGDGRSPDGLQPVCHVQEIQILEERDFEAVKRAVYENGGVQSSFYMPQTAGAERDRYYKEETDSFYYDGTLEPNHDVVIVGWNDEYPKENFVTAPEQDGAFLCMNTWGEEFGNDGFFYISYEDSRIGSSVAYTGIESVDNYDRIFQTDLCGWTGQMGYGTEDAWFANVYEAGDDIKLAAAGFYATAPDTEYKIYAADGDTLSDRVTVAEGHVSNAGFYTVPWEQEISVSAGERFAVIIEINSPGSSEPVAIEYQAGSRTSNVDISDGEGYISSDGVSWERTETAHQCNICLKAYGHR